MQYNICSCCGACNGRAGVLISSEVGENLCANCHDTARDKVVTLHMHLVRTAEEVEKTISLLKDK